MRRSSWAAVGLLSIPVVITCGAADEKRAVRDAGAAVGGAFDIAAGAAGQPGNGVITSPDAGAAGAERGGAPNDGKDGTSGAGGAGGDSSSDGGVPNEGAAGSSAEGGGGAVGSAGAGGSAGEAGVPEPAGMLGDDFDDEALLTDELSSFNHTTFAQWNVVAGSADLTLLPNGFIQSPGGYGPGQPADGVVVDLNGSTYELGTIETKLELEFAAGVSYTLVYSIGNARPEANAATVSIPGLLSRTHSYPTAAAFSTYRETFTPASTSRARLRFESTGNADYDGLLLDNVSITRN